MMADQVLEGPMIRSTSASSSTLSAAASDLAFDSQPSAASTSSSGWTTVSTFGGSDRRSISSVDDDPDEVSRQQRWAARDVLGAAVGDDGTVQSWRRGSKLDSAGELETGVETIDLSSELDGDQQHERERSSECDFGARRPPATGHPLASTAAFTSSPGSPSPAWTPILPEPNLEPPVFPLGRPLIRILFCKDDPDDLVPPCFFPGQSIPTLVTLELPRFTSLPHNLRPALNMSLVGTLRLPPSLVGEDIVDDEDEWAERVLINVGVGLQDGMDLWQKDATVAWKRLSEKKKRGRSNPEFALPGGKYTLPLTVQVPSNPVLPPSFDLPDSAFEVSYQLTVSLTVDDPDPPAPDERPRRIVLSRSSQPFALLPTTLPTLAPDVQPIQGLLEAPRRDSISKLVGSASSSWLDRFNGAMEPLKSGFGVPSARSASVDLPGDLYPTSWSILPSVPTTSYSPSSTIPVDFALNPPSALPSASLPNGHLIIRASLLRREFLYTSSGAPTVTDANEGLLSEETVASASHRVNLLDLYSTDGKLPRLSVPLGYGSTGVAAWDKGFSSSLSVTPSIGSSSPHIHCASRFFLSIHVTFLSPSNLARSPSLATDEGSDPSVASYLPSRTVVIPISVGSVGEPPGSNRRVWREMYIGRDDATGEERPSMVEGFEVDREEGWIVAPPSYEFALGEPAYSLG